MLQLNFYINNKTEMYKVRLVQFDTFDWHTRTSSFDFIDE